MGTELIHSELSESIIGSVVTGFSDTNLAQMIGYLNITGLRLALLLNFKYSQLQWKRVVR